MFRFLKVEEAMIYLSVFLILIICAIFTVLLNKWVKIYINPNTYPNNIWYRNNLQRNYKYIVLGNGIVRDLFPVDWRKGCGFCLALRNQSLKRDFEVLKQNFSILKENGYAVFVLTEDSLYRTNDVPDKRPYVYTSYSYSLSLSHFVQSYKKFCKYYPICMIRPIDLFYCFLHFIGKNEQTYFDTKRLLTHKKSNGANVGDFMNIVSEIKTFCEARGINAIFPILDVGHMGAKETIATMTSLCSKLNVRSYIIDTELGASRDIEDLIFDLR